MTAHIFVHLNGEIVKKFVIVFDELSELQDILDVCREQYKGDDFCFDVMIV